jgi:hypothetical protein
MAFKVFTPGVLTSSDVNTFLMRQAVIVCTSTTRPGSPNEGMTIYETDTDLTLQYTGTAWRRVLNLGQWQTYTPTLTNFTLGNGTIATRFFVSGRLCVVLFEITFGSTTAVGSPKPAISLPIANSGFYATSNATLFDVSAGTTYAAHLVQDTALGVVISRTTATNGNLSEITSTAPFTWAAGDLIAGRYIYQTTGVA